MIDDLFDRFLELSPDAMIVVGTNGKIAMVNRQTEKMFGYRRADLIGGPIEMLIPKGAKTRHRKHRAAYFDSPKTRPMGRNLDLKGITRDGREFPVEIRLGPLETRDGTLAVAAVRDVSEKRRAEAETLDAKDEVIAAGEQLKSAIESIAEGFVLFDSKGRLVLCNSTFRAFHGYSAADTKPGVATYESLNRLDKVRDLHDHKRRSFHKSIADLRRSGTFRITEMIGQRVIERRQELTREGGIISVQTDITDRMQAEFALQGQIKFSGLLQRITIAANQATSVEGVLQFCLDEVCAAIGWPVGHVYQAMDDGSGDFISTNLWRLDVPKRKAWIKRFTDGEPFTPSRDLIGRVMANGLPAWIVDVTKDPTFERMKLAENLGIKAGFAFPVLTGRKVVAIIELFSHEAVEPDGHMLEIMAQIGTQLGRVIERRAAENTLRARIEAAGLLQKITVAANEAPTVEDALQICLDAVCDFTGWPVGHVFLQAEGKTDHLESAGLWHIDNPRKFAAFKRVTQDMHFFLGKGLLSRILANGKPAWVADVSESPLFERAKHVKNIGVKAAFAFPVLTGKDIAAVFEFFSPDALEADQNILDVMAQIGTQLGRVIERRAAQEALQESEERFRFVMDNSPAAVNLKDREGRYLLVNARFEEWYGLAAEDVIGKTVKEIFPRLKLAPFAAMEREVLRLKTPSEREFEIDFADGTKHLIQGSKFIVNDSKGAAMGIGTIEIDITEPRRIETQLRQAQKMEAVGQLTGGIAHDFNNLLAVISGNLELLDETLEGDARRQELLRWAIAAADDAATLTQRLLAFSRQQTLVPRTLLINDLVENLLTMLHRTLGEVVDVETDLRDSLWLTTVDPAQFENAVLNLVLNARDAMPEGGVITITTANVSLMMADDCHDPDMPTGDHVKLSVSDTGHGLSPEALDHAFEPFYTTKKFGQGSGLGLSMVYGFSKQSGGYAEIESVEGRGATASIYLPRASASDGLVPPAVDPATPRGKGEVVLVVEDEERWRALAVRLIRDLGYEVLEAAHAKAAPEILHSDIHIDLLLTDMILPGGVSGRDLVAQATAKRPALAVIYVSGNLAALEADSPIEEGAMRLAKPYRKKDLVVALRRVLGNDVAGAGA